jgi:TRAP-type C4-dicarboxylate transport system permease small subunit
MGADGDTARGRATALTREAAPGSRAQTWTAALRRLEDVTGILLFSAMLVVVLVQVFVRFVLYLWIQIAWADEIGRALLVWSSFWGAVLVTRESRHITVDLLYERLPTLAQWMLRIVGDLVMVGFLLLVLTMGLPIFLDSLRRASPATNLPFFIFDGALWTSSALMIAHVALNAVHRWRPSQTPTTAPALTDPL